MPVELTAEKESVQQHLNWKNMFGTQRTARNFCPVYYRTKSKAAFLKLQNLLIMIQILASFEIQLRFTDSGAMYEKVDHH